MRLQFLIILLHGQLKFHNCISKKNALDYIRIVRFKMAPIETHDLLVEFLLFKIVLRACPFIEDIWCDIT